MRNVPFLKSWLPGIPLNTDTIPIEQFPTPKQARLLTSGSDIAAQPGDSVKTGQRLAPDVISPVTGTITQIKPFLGVDGEGLTSISIDVAEQDEFVGGLRAISNPAEHTRDELVAALGGLGFPIRWGDDVDVVVLNYLDTDPVQTVNQQVFRENADALGDVVTLLTALTGLDRVVLAVTKQLQNVAKRAGAEGVRIAVVDPDYPNGLPDVLLPKVEPAASRGLVIGAERAFAMSQALRTGKPRQDKVLTLSVPAMELCKNLRVRIGTPIADIIRTYEINMGENHKLILGGAMRGAACYSDDFAVTPTTDSIYVQDEGEVVEYEGNPCVNCGKCSAVCPVDLQANLICRYSEYGLFEECRELRVDDCIECGLCAYTCMARRPLVHYIKLAKAEIAKKPEPEPEGGTP